MSSEAIIKVPNQRKNLKFSQLNITEFPASIFFNNDDKDAGDNDVICHLEVSKEEGFLKITNSSCLIEKINKYIEKHLAGQHFPERLFDEKFREFQRRIKPFIHESNKAEKTELEEAKTETETKVEMPKKKIESKVVVIERPKAVGLEGQLQDIVFNVLESDFTTQTLQNKMIELGLEPNRTEIVVKKLDGTKKNVGVQHKEFKTILQCVSAKVNIALVGPAGSGKTTTVSQVAKALDLPFYSKSVSAQTGVHEFFGYQDANGKYVRTLFREAYENGGVFLLDEFDAGNPNVLASMNQATANGSCAFADGMIQKHEDFIVVMAGNTYGNGATQEYVGRNKIDSATLDRFAFIQFDYDLEMEYQLATNKEWCKEVQELRNKANTKKIKTIISPRATFEGEKMLSVGMPKSKVLELIIFKGMNEAERKLLS